MSHRTSGLTVLACLALALTIFEGCGSDDSSSPVDVDAGAAGADGGSGEGGSPGAQGGSVARGGAAPTGGNGGGGTDGGGDPGSSGAGGSDAEGGSEAAGNASGGSSGGSAGADAAGGTSGGSDATGGSAEAGQGGDEGTIGGSAGAAGAPATGGESGSAGAAGMPSAGPNLVFVTSQGYVPESLGGLEGADARCQELADAQGLEGTFVAWLSDSTTDARDRLGTARGWVTTDGKPFVDRVEDLVAGDYWYPPQATQTGARTLGSVMTGTAADGTALAADGDFCQDYTGENPDVGVVYGQVDAWGVGWTAYSQQFLNNQHMDCDAGARFYCFQIDHETELVPDFPASRRVFVTLGTPMTSSGIEGFDELCATEADDAGLTGSFLAFVSTTVESAAARFDLGGDTWAHLSGIPIVENAADIATATTLLVPITHFSDGTSIEGGLAAELIHAGSTLPNALGADASTCNDWSISVFDNKMMVGLAGQTDATWWSYQTDAPCNTWRHVYCFEE